MHPNLIINLLQDSAKEFFYDKTELITKANDADKSVCHRIRVTTTSNDYRDAEEFIKNMMKFAKELNVEVKVRIFY